MVEGSSIECSIMDSVSGVTHPHSGVQLRMFVYNGSSSALSGGRPRKINANQE